MSMNPVGDYISNNLIGSDRAARLRLSEVKSIAVDDLYRALDSVVDPEIPVLSARELGVLRGIAWQGDELVVTITPTYSGCPAMTHFEDDIISALEKIGVFCARIHTSLSPAWTTDWLSEPAKQKLLDYGIAPPSEASTSKRALLGEDPVVSCPKCSSQNNTEVSRHGSTACKALYKCNDCEEPFDYFKCI